MRQKRSQSSVELVLVIGTTGMMLLMSLFVINSYAIGSTDQMIDKQVQTIGESFVKNTEIVSLFGYPSRRVAEYRFPANIQNITLIKNHTIIIEYHTTGKDVAAGFYSNANITLDLDDMYFTPGPKKFLFECNKTGSVIISRWQGT